MNSTDISICQKWLKANGKRKIQSFQDSCADLFGISLGVISLDGKSLTVWSNSSLFCHYILQNNNERCRHEKQAIIDFVTQKGETVQYTCYMDITYFACPIFYNEDLVAICLGGGVHIEENKRPSAQDLHQKIPVLSEAQLNEIMKLLENVFHLLNGSEDESPSAETPKDKVKQELFFLEKKLSLRELEIVKLINSGLTNKEISNNLNISEKTVKTHITNILRKLNMRDRLEIVIFCKNNI